MSPQWKPKRFQFNLPIVINVLVVGLFLGLIMWSQWDSLWFQAKDEAGGFEEVDIKLLDALDSAEIARNLASFTRYREQTWIDLQAYNSRLIIGASPSMTPLVEKPAVINSTIRTRKDITTYVVSPGDTLLGLARAYNVSVNSIRWSNNIKNNSLPVGQTILIPPRGLNGIVYEVKVGDDLEIIADKYDFSPRTIINFNDLDPDLELQVGELIFMPHGIRNPLQDLPAFLSDSYNIAAAEFKDENCFNCGKFVEAGDRIGRLGNTGWSTGPHLHLEIFSGPRTIYNPWSFLSRNNLVWPVDQTQKRITQTYHYAHKALDIGDDEGVDILAIAAGEIIYRGCLWTGTRWSTFGVIIDHGAYYSLYIHLQAPNNSLYENCSINRRSQYGVPSIDYNADI